MNHLSKFLLLAIAVATPISLSLAKAVSPKPGRRIASIAAATQKIKAPALSSDDETLIRQLPLRVKIGQMLFLGFTGTTIDETLAATIANVKPGGLVMFGRNIKTAPQVAELNRAAQGAAMKASGLPLLVGVDQEGGNVLRIKTTYPLPSALAFGTAGDAKLVERAGQATGRLLRTLGFNMDLAPVLDVGDAQSERFIGTRSYGSDPALVSLLGSSFSQGLQSERILPTTKHFPGHGGVTGDSHLALPERKATLAQMEKHDLVPFESLQKSVAKPWAVMLAHVSYPDLDPSGAPASFSKPIVTDLLRNRIGFGGVVITDDIQMAGAGLIEDVRERAVRAVEAGADMIMITWNRKTQSAVAKALYRAVKSGRITEERIDESLRRIVAAKREFAPPGAKSTFDQLRVAVKSKDFQTIGNETVAAIFKKDLSKPERSFVDYARDRSVILFSANPSFVRSFKAAATDRSARSYDLADAQTFNVDKIMRSNPEAAGLFYVSGSQAAKVASRISADVAARILIVTVEPPGILKNAEDFRAISEVYYRHPQLGQLVAERYFATPSEDRRLASIQKPKKKRKKTQDL